MQVNRIQANVSNNSEPNFNGSVGKSMKKYIDYQMERDLKNWYARDKEFGPFANTSIVVDRIKAIHTQVKDKLSKFMEIFEPNISMENHLGIVSLQNKTTGEFLSFIMKHEYQVPTGKIYVDDLGYDRIDMFSPVFIESSGESTLLYMDNFATSLEKNLDIENIKKTLAK